MEKVKMSKPIILLLIIGAVYFFLKYITPLVTPVLCAMLFVTIFGNTLKKMQDKLHIHRQVGAIILLLVGTLVGVLLIWILLSWIISSFPGWLDQLDVVEKEFAVLLHGVCEVVGNALRLDSTYMEETILSGVQEGIDYFQVQVVPGMLSHSFSYLKILGIVGAFLVTFIIASVLLAKDYDEIMNRLLEREDCHVLLEVICGIIRYIATFVKAQLIIIGVMATLTAVVLWIFGIEQGVLWGILAGCLDALPFVGTGIVLFPLALVQIFDGAYVKALVCILLFVACIFLRELLEPKLIGKRMGVNPVAILVSIYAGVQLFGLWGIVKGPLGFIIIYLTYQSIQRRWPNEDGNDTDDDSTSVHGGDREGGGDLVDAKP